MILNHENPYTVHALSAGTLSEAIHKSLLRLIVTGANCLHKTGDVSAKKSRLT
jgi:hypothetical protein